MLAGRFVRSCQVTESIATSEFAQVRFLQNLRRFSAQALGGRVLYPTPSKFAIPSGPITLTPVVFGQALPPQSLPNMGSCARKRSWTVEYPVFWANVMFCHVVTLASLPASLRIRAKT